MLGLFYLVPAMSFVIDYVSVITFELCLITLLKYTSNDIIKIRNKLSFLLFFGCLKLPPSLLLQNINLACRYLEIGTVNSVSNANKILVYFCFMWTTYEIHLSVCERILKKWTKLQKAISIQWSVGRHTAVDLILKVWSNGSHLVL